MISYNKDKNEINIVLNKKFYDINAINESIKDFKETCKSEVKEEDEIIKIIPLKTISESLPLSPVNNQKIPKRLTVTATTTNIKDIAP